jgi:hypothetical protein
VFISFGADALGELGERRLVRRQVELDAAGVHGAADLAALEVCHDCLAGVHADGGLRLVGAGAQVRREHHVVQPEQRVVLRRRLGLEHVQRRPAHLLLLQRVRQRILVHHLAARVVDDQQVGLAAAEQPLPVEQVLGALAAGDVEGDDVELGEEFIEVLDHLHFAVQSGRRVEVRVKAQDVHLHRDGAGGDGAADAA